MYDPEYYCEVTIRAQDGDFCFDPNDIDLCQLIYGVFAEAARWYGVEIFIFHFMSNHYHGLFGYRSPGQFEAFIAYLHGNLARLANEHVGRSGTFWCKPKMLAVSRDAESVAARFKYIMGQAVRANICIHPGEFPGASAVDALLYGTPLIGRKVDRAQRCRDTARLKGGAKQDSTYETVVEVPLSVPHCWLDLSPADLRRLYLGIAQEIAAEAGADLSGQLDYALAQSRDHEREPTSLGRAEAPAVQSVATRLEATQGLHQVPGTCLIHDMTADFVALPSPEPPNERSHAPARACQVAPQREPTASSESVPPAKVPVPLRQAEDGGRYRHGKVKAKLRAGVKMRSKVPLLFSVHPRLVAEYEERYKLAVEAYYSAKLVWRQKSKFRKGILHSAPIEIPMGMRLGTMPLFVGG